MASKRKIQAPGIELREIDRSQYDQEQDNSIVGTTSLVVGFADKGTDYQVNYINSVNTFKSIYGTPQTEAERYFYNAAYEIMNRGGRMYAAKLPYNNNSLDKYSYTTYQVLSGDPVLLSSPYELLINDMGASELTEKPTNLYDFFLYPNIRLETVIALRKEYTPGEDEEDIVNEITENGYILIDSGDSYYNLTSFCDKYDVNLSIIGDMFEYTQSVVNFNYDSQDFIDNIFKKNGHYRCNSVYMLSDLMSDKEKFKQDYIIVSEMSEVSSQYCEQADQIYNSLVEYGDIDSILQIFGKSQSLEYYRNYLYNLRSTFLNLSIAEEQDKYVRDNIILLLDSYNQKELIVDPQYTSIKQYCEDLTSYLQISANPTERGYSGLIEAKTVDQLMVKDQEVPKNQIMFVNTSKMNYDSDTKRGENREYIGLGVAMTTAANALYYQNLLSVSDGEKAKYRPIHCMNNTWSNLSSNMLTQINNENSVVTSNKIAGFTRNFGSESNVTESEDTISKDAVSYFPKFTFKDGRLAVDDARKIGVVVYQMYRDSSNEDKISMQLLESFTGSLNRYDVDKDTGKTNFIDNIINNNSNYIKCFSNVPHSRDRLTRKTPADYASIFMVNDQSMTSLGIYQSDRDKIISLQTSIQKALTTIFDSLKDYNRHRIDLVVDAGVSNIAQYIYSVYLNQNKEGYYDLESKRAHLFNINDQEHTKIWRSIINKYDDFCKYTRKDCMFIADGMRPLCLIGNEKVVRNTKPENTIENTVLKYIKNMSGFINSSYGAGYCDWFKCVDQSSEDYFWCPPSIKAAGIYTYTDAYSHFWMAPAGMNRGGLPSDVVDVAFSPTIDEAGTIYNNNWNYSVNYPIDGIVMEGQRTFQKDKTALDRVNIRRLCLGLEKGVKYLAKYFNYEQNTPYLRQRFTDSITNLLESVKAGDGISEYYVICDDRNNTTQTIENNELHVTIAVKPIKCVEFIICNFIVSNQSANVQELVESEL